MQSVFVTDCGICIEGGRGSHEWISWCALIRVKVTLHACNPPDKFQGLWKLSLMNKSVSLLFQLSSSHYFPSDVVLNCLQGLVIMVCKFFILSQYFTLDK